MHKHITYYTKSTVCQRGFYERISSNKVLSSSLWAYAGFSKGRTQVFGELSVCRSQAFVRGVRGHASPRTFFEWCNFLMINLSVLVFTSSLCRHHQRNCVWCRKIPPGSSCEAISIILTRWRQQAQTSNIHKQS